MPPRRQGQRGGAVRAGGSVASRAPFGVSPQDWAAYNELLDACPRISEAAAAISGQWPAARQRQLSAAVSRAVRDLLVDRQAGESMVQERPPWTQILVVQLTAAYLVVPPAGANRQSALDLLGNLWNAHGHLSTLSSLAKAEGRFAPPDMSSAVSKSGLLQAYARQLGESAAVLQEAVVRPSAEELELARLRCSLAFGAMALCTLHMGESAQAGALQQLRAALEDSGLPELGCRVLLLWLWHTQSTRALERDFGG
jgi:hypothetical protein